MEESETYKLLEQHTELRRRCLNMIPSESIMSPATRRALASDLGIRYTGKIYSGNEHYKKIEEHCHKLLEKIFKARYINIKPVTGMLANLASLYALAEKGETILSPREEFGSHYSHLEYHSHYGRGSPALLGIHTSELPFDAKEYVVDVDAAKKAIRAAKPRAIILGTTSFLFPAPIRELKDACNDAGTSIMYDGAQVVGLIAGGEFQKPLEEGADIFSTSTNKTLCAPAHGLVMTNEPEKFKEKLDEFLTSMTISIYHLHHIAGLAVTLEEFEKYGAGFAKQIIRNSHSFAQGMHENGVNVCFAHKNFTKSHIVLVDAGADSSEHVKKLEKSNINASTWILPHNKNGPMTGIRFGTTELTRIGFTEKDMVYAGELVARSLMKNYDARKEVEELMKEKQECHYCLTGYGKAYDF